MLNYFNATLVSLCLIFLFLIPISAHAASLKYEGSTIELKVPIEIVNGKSYISTIDFTNIHRINYSVDAFTRVLTFTYNNQKYTWYIDNNKLDTPKGSVSINYIINNKGYYMLPLRDIHAAFGLYVAYDYNTKSVLISKNPIKDIPLQPQWSIPTMKLNPTSNIKVPILCYHVVSDGKADILNTPYWKLEEHLKALKEKGYTAITPKQLYEAYYLKKPLPKKPVLITFDDGYYDNYTRGYPLLKKYDMQATIFIVGNTIHDTKNLSLNGGIPKLSWENIKAMQSHVTVQNHTYASHYKVKNSEGKEIGVIATPIQINGKTETNAEFWIRIGNDINKLEKKMKETVGYGSYIFSYPYGHHSYTTKKVLEQLQIPLAVTVKPGLATNNSNIYELHRLPVYGFWSGENLIKQIEKLK